MSGTSKKAWVAIVGALLSVVVIAWVAASPWLAVRSMDRALKEGDGIALADHVDFPALRENLKSTFNAHMAKGLGQDSTSGAAVFAIALGSLMIDRLVDGLVTAEGLQLMFQGKPARSVEERRPQGTKPDESDKRRGFNQSARYETMNRFVVERRPAGTTDPGVQLVFRREGLASWKLVGIRLPDDVLSAASK